MGTSILSWDGRSFQIGDRVKYTLGYFGTVTELVSASTVEVRWDGAIGTTLTRVSELLNLGGGGE
ncbi:hypothetical protein LCGC14_1495890 [marine sediment metagenome]|uniref:Uncharacterized protein n=1 Tax=marine sediment metagenome TaxID=412755 RepID=A0A0F9J5F8_9ZZZZ